MKKLLVFLLLLCLSTPIMAQESEDDYSHIDGSFRPTGNVHIDKIYREMTPEQRRKEYIKQEKQKKWESSLDAEEKAYWDSKAMEVLNHPDYKKHLMENLKILSPEDQERIRASLGEQNEVKY